MKPLLAFSGILKKPLHWTEGISNALSELIFQTVTADIYIYKKKKIARERQKTKIQVSSDVFILFYNIAVRCYYH